MRNRNRRNREIATVFRHIIHRLPPNTHTLSTMMLPHECAILYTRLKKRTAHPNGVCCPLRSVDTPSGPRKATGVFTPKEKLDGYTPSRWLPYLHQSGGYRRADRVAGAPTVLI